LLRARNIGPYPEAVRKAWTHIKAEAMQNYGLREGSKHEEWGRLGPLAEPTPANAKNKGEANRRSRRRDEQRETGRSGEESREREEQEGYDEQGGRVDNEAMETQEAREAMAEAIREMEREEEETGGSGNEEQRRTQTESTRPGPLAFNTAEDEEGRQARAAETTERQRSGHGG
jgi:hypothetical protein